MAPVCPTSSALVQTCQLGKRSDGDSLGRSRPECCKHLTLMRSPVVKGHTTPESGFFDFFSAVVEDQRRQPLATCSVFISVWGAPTWLHQTLMEVRAPRRRRVQ